MLYCSGYCSIKSKGQMYVYIYIYIYSVLWSRAFIYETCVDTLVYTGLCVELVYADVRLPWQIGNQLHHEKLCLRLPFFLRDSFIILFIPTKAKWGRPRWCQGSTSSIRCAKYGIFRWRPKISRKRLSFQHLKEWVEKFNAAPFLSSSSSSLSLTHTHVTPHHTWLESIT